jgi:hypothetical protein
LRHGVPKWCRAELAPQLRTEFSAFFSAQDGADRTTGGKAENTSHECPQYPSCHAQYRGSERSADLLAECPAGGSADR